MFNKIEEIFVRTFGQKIKENEYKLGDYYYVY